MTVAYKWLVENGLWHYVVGGLVGVMMGVCVRPLISGAWRELTGPLHSIADKVDDSTPGGLGAVRDIAIRVEEDVTEILKIVRDEGRKRR